MNLQAVDTKPHRQRKTLPSSCPEMTQAPLENIQVASKILYPESETYMLR
jgi:hypothetical protein